MSLFLTTVIFFVYIQHYIHCKPYIDPQVDWTLEERIAGHGYPVQTYKIITEDGYVLSLYHISNDTTPNPEHYKGKSPVLLVHGMGGSPHNFVVLGARRALPYYFYDRGYDVWLFSARGSEGSFPERHVKYDWDQDKAYWKYSLHEIAIYDLPACIDFILIHTSREKVALIGHSAAGNEFFAMFSERPEYNAKVTVAVSWASAPILKRSDYPLALLFSTLVDVWKGLNNLLGLEEFVPITQTFKPVIRLACADSEFRKICILVTAVIGSHTSVIQHPEDIQVIASNLPRLSSRQIYHFMDNVNNGSFRKYDYGPKKNLKTYGQLYPPHYNIAAAKVPTAFFLGRRDSIIQLEVNNYYRQFPFNWSKIQDIFDQGVPYTLYNTNEKALTISNMRQQHFAIYIIQVGCV
ncbi:lipase 3-like isoform X2 [Anthonomus grandis grandis]|uniref:lipase 3-like isoform X2 n=1 Tax=Anthonomus grandis grandis TaxID=2921223 RepID=UPI0021667DCF|nr:lipase 3-like isoform X2 [Anthonomus grandis grandis]